MRRTLRAKVLIFVFVTLYLITAYSFTSYAVTVISDGNYDYAVYNDNEFALYRYKGNDLNPELPEEFLGKKIAGIYSNCFYESDIVSVNIPNSYSFIGGLAFYGAENLTEITVPKGITYIGNMAFNSCTSLETADFSAAAELDLIPYAAFQDASSLKRVVFPDNLTQIDERAFTRTAIENIVIPESVTVIGGYAFSECSNLSSVTLPKKLEEVSRSMFEDCVSLSVIDLPIKPEKIGYRAFYNTSVTSIYIPKSVKTIGEGIFSDNGVEVGVAQGSAADSYCAENGFTNVTRYVLGDANSDGTMNITDATYIQKYCANLRSFNSAAQKDVADVTGDGEVSVRDATLIQMRLAEIISSFD